MKDRKIPTVILDEEEVSEIERLSEKNPVTEELWKERFKALKNLRQRMEVQQGKEAEELKAWARKQFRKFEAEIALKYREIIKKNRIEYRYSIAEILNGVENPETVKFNRILPDPEFFMEFRSLNERDLVMMTTREC